MNQKFNELKSIAKKFRDEAGRVGIPLADPDEDDISECSMRIARECEVYAAEGPDDIRAVAKQVIILTRAKHALDAYYKDRV